MRLHTAAFGSFTNIMITHKIRIPSKALSPVSTSLQHSITHSIDLSAYFKGLTSAF